MKDYSYITNSSPAFIENLYRDFVSDPDSVDPELKKFFEGFDFAMNAGVNGNGKPAAPSAKAAATDTSWFRELNAYRLIQGYRNKGHLLADTNPIRDMKATTGKEMADQFPTVAGMIDKLAKRGVIHKNKAANLKSKLAKKVNATAK